MVKSFWFAKKVLVTGGAGFIGSYLVEALLKRGAKVTVADNLQSGSLANLKEVLPKINFLKTDLQNPKNCLAACRGQEAIFNLAARVAGVHYNIAHPAIMLKDNVAINLNMLEVARRAKVERFLVVSSACVYPRFCRIPTPEEEGFKDDPEPTNFGYGWAKRIAEVAGRAFAQEFGLKVGIVRPYNTYGPRDKFDPKVSHVIPALIKRILDGEDPVVVWGSGRQTRAFLYVEDLVRGMMLALEKYPVPDPINLGTKEEVKIKDLVKLIIKLSKKSPKVIFDTAKPEGQPRRNCEIRKAKEKIGFLAKTPLEDGLKKTIAWYKNEFAKEA